MITAIMKRLGALSLVLLAFTLSSSAQVCAPAPVDLISWWSGDGNFLDSRSRNNGTAAGASFVAGQVGQAFSLTNAISIPAAPNLNVVGSISGEAWVFPETFPNTYPRIFEKNNGSNQWLFTLANDGTINSSLGLNIAGQALYAPNNTISLGQWSHVAFTYDSATGQTRLFVNGDQAATGTLPAGLTTSGNGNFLIGNNPDGNRFFDGLIDELAIYNTVLEPAQIAAIHAAGTAGKCKPTATVAPPGLAGWWSGDGNANDTSGNANNGALESGASFAVGHSGQSFRFNGENQVVRVPSSSALNPAGSFSLSIWIYPTTASQRAYVFSKWGQLAPWSLERAYAMVVDTSGRVQFAIADDINQNNAPFHGFFSSNDAWTPNTWTHLVAVYDQTSGERRIYSNGLLVGTRTDPSITITDSVADLAIGAGIARPDDGIIAEFQGRVDEAAFFNRALTQDEITSITNAGSAGKLKQNATIDSDSIVSVWQAEGNAVDTRGANNGTFAANTYAPGRLGQAFTLNGVNDFVDVGVLPQINNNASELTVMGWIRRQNDAASSDGGIIGKWVNDSNQPQSFLLILGGGGFNQNVGAFIIRFDDGTQGFLQDDTVIPNDTWTHIAATWRSSDGLLKLYKNGIEEGSTIAGLGRTMRNSAISAKIGSWGVGTNVPSPNFPGQIDEPAILSRALTAAEIRSAYEAGNPLSTVAGDVRVTMPSGTTIGTTQQIPLLASILPPLPMGVHTGLIYDIATSAAFTGSPDICVNLPSFNDASVFEDLRVVHLEAGVWENRTSSSDFATRTLCAQVATLSPFAIAQFAPTAAPVAVTGRVMDQYGRGIRGVSVVTVSSDGTSKTATTNSFGRYKITELAAGNTYVLSAQSRRYQFENPTRVISLSADLAEENFVASPPNRISVLREAREPLPK